MKFFASLEAVSMSEHSSHIVDHLFRHESGRMIAVLTRIFGIHNLQLAEDVVQDAFLKASQTWRFDQLPENPSAWLLTVAKNKALDIIRRQQNFQQYSKELARELQNGAESAIEQFFLDDEISDSQLRMIFACCHPSLKEEDQVAITLKILSGFGVKEIARALVTNESAITKRIYRAKEFIRENNIQLEIPSSKELGRRLETVHTVLYLLFNEGYNSLKADELIRKDLCAEAMRLCYMLSQHSSGNKPSTYALLSLMCFQASRFESRIDENKSIILLKDQDRTKWNKQLIAMGYQYLVKSSSGEELTCYHIESAIAAEHCAAENFAATDWKRLLQLYNLLLEHKPTPVVILNKAVVLGKLNQANTGIQELLSIKDIEKLLESQYMYNAVLGDLYDQVNDCLLATKFFNRAKELTTSLAEKKLMDEKLERLARISLS